MRTGSAESLSAAVTALLANFATLVCCVLPAALVSVGAGAVVVGLVTAVPQLIWLSEHKLAVFGTAAAFLMLSGGLLWRARRLPCPADPALASKCMRLRKASLGLYAGSIGLFLLGVVFAFVLPQLQEPLQLAMRKLDGPLGPTRYCAAHDCSTPVRRF
jgi:hypothetical protein